jgi:hypothetical protein
MSTAYFGFIKLAASGDIHHTTTSIAIRFPALTDAAADMPLMD